MAIPGRMLLQIGCTVIVLAALDRAAAERPALFDVWTPAGLSAPDELPLTDRARASMGLDEAREELSAVGCQPGMPDMLETRRPIELVDAGDRILMRFEEWNLVRTVYMNPARGPAIQAHSATGVSFGRWEGATLAIFTTYIDYPFFDRRGTPQSRDVTVLERYTANDDQSRLDLRITVTDPATFSQPVVRTGVMFRRTAADGMLAAATEEQTEPLECKLNLGP